MRAAVHGLCAANFAELDQLMRESLFAWLCAFQHHWPTRFDAMLGIQGHEAVAALVGSAGDSGRYLKLRRIAIENLSAVL
jgi:hypothetical protein